jgi:hypothetical protein
MIVYEFIHILLDLISPRRLGRRSSVSCRYFVSAKTTCLMKYILKIWRKTITYLF